MTSGTATTSTTTATSTSPTGTSTTSRSSTPAATRPTATRSQGEDAIWSHRWKAFQNTGQGPTGQQGRRHADRHHRPVGRGLHDPARERRRLRVHPRVRPRPRPAGPLRHRGRPGQRRQLVDADGPEPRLGAPRTRASAPAPPTSARGTSCSSAGSTTRSSVAGQNRTLDLGPHEYNSDKAQGLVVVLPDKSVTHDVGAPAAGHQAVVVGRGRRLRRHAHPPGRDPGRARPRR